MEKVDQQQTPKPTLTSTRRTRPLTPRRASHVLLASAKHVDTRLVVLSYFWSLSALCYEKRVLSMDDTDQVSRELA